MKATNPLSTLLNFASVFQFNNGVSTLEKDVAELKKDDLLNTQVTALDQEENLGNDDEEPKRKVASKSVWFTKPKQPKEPTDPDWNVGKTPQQGPTQSWLMTLASSADNRQKPLMN
ncbi:hypothetical protein Tco_1237982 [Tanacetum coccineum]